MQFHIGSLVPENHPTYNVGCNGPIARYVKLGLAHAPGTFSPPPTSKETASKRSRHASRHEFIVFWWLFTSYSVHNTEQEVRNFPCCHCGRLFHSPIAQPLTAGICLPFGLCKGTVNGFKKNVDICI